MYLFFAKNLISVKLVLGVGTTLTETPPINYRIKMSKTKSQSPRTAVKSTQIKSIG